MAALLGTYGLVKQLHLAFRVTLEDVSDDVSNTDLYTTSGFAALTGVSTYSPLYTFLNTTFVDTVAAETAFRALGGRVTARQVSGTATTVITVKWDAQNSKPFINFGNGDDQVMEVVVSVPHSSIQ